MSEFRRWCVGVAAVVALGSPAQARAQQPLGVEDAVREAIKQSPTLAAQALTRRGAALDIERESGRFVPNLNADAGIRAGQTPQPGPQGIQIINTQSITTQVGLSYVSTWGTAWTGGVNVDRSVRDSVILGNLGVVWSTGVTFGVTQPLMRGFGPRIGEASVRDAEVGVLLADVEQARQARELAREVRQAYWQLWYIDRELEIAHLAMELAERARVQGQDRVDAGLGAGVDLINLETEIASAQERLVQAKAQRRARVVELGRLMGRGPGEVKTLRVQKAAPQAGEPPTLASVREKTRERSPELRRLDLEKRRAEIAAAGADDQARPNLEGVATLNINGLGQGVGESLSQLARFEAVVGYVGLRLDLPLINQARLAQAERARLTVQRLKQDRRAVELRLDAQAATLLGELEASTRRVELSRKTTELARRSVANVSVRFDNAQATALEVVQVLQRQREAELRAVRALVDREVARVALEALMAP